MRKPTHVLRGEGHRRRGAGYERGYRAVLLLHDECALGRRDVGAESMPRIFAPPSERGVVAATSGVCSTCPTASS